MASKNVINDGQSTSGHSEKPSTSKDLSTEPQNLSTNIVKGTVGIGSFVALACGLRSAWKYSRFEEAKTLKHAEVLSGVGFATRALAVATCITLSGFTLAVVGISCVLNVNTPKQFGKSIKDFFGDTFRLEASKTSVSSEDLEQLLSNFSINKKEGTQQSKTIDN